MSIHIKLIIQISILGEDRGWYMGKGEDGTWGWQRVIHGEGRGWYKGKAEGGTWGRQRVHGT